MKSLHDQEHRSILVLRHQRVTTRAAMTPFTLRLFGPGVLAADGAVVRTHSARTLALLCFLVVEPNRPHARSTLADLLWLQDVSESAGVVEDLARSLQALAADTAYLKALIDALPMPVWLRDEDLSLLTVNRAYAAAVDSASPEAVVVNQVELASDNLVRARALARARAAGNRA
jgi:PAS domain-containing protein